ncbi:MAG: MFS transporter [Verrucomicrobiae bacterium]
MNDRSTTRSGTLPSWGAAELFFTAGVAVAILFAVLSGTVSKSLGINQAQLGQLSGIYTLAYSVGQLLLGIVLTSRNIKALLGIGAALGAAGCFLLSASTGYATAFAAQILLGIGFSGTFVGLIFLIGRDFSANFSFMSSLSQSITNIAGAALSITASLTPWLADFRLTFRVMAAALLGVAVLQFLLVRGKSAEASAAAPPSTPFLVALRLAASNLQFWWAAIYYAGLFGTMLAFANLWNIQFQINYFGNTPQQSAMMNAMVAIGITIGSIIAGMWAKKAGFLLPSRAFALLSLAIFIVMALLPLPRWEATAFILIMGFGLAGSILALSVVYAHIPPAATAVATSLVVTAAFVHGAILQTLIGNSLASATPAIAAAGSAHAAIFTIYQHGMVWLLGSVACSVIASFLFRPAPAK